jgi:hypothetical protein
MKEISLGDLQESVRDKTAFNKLQDYLMICCAFLDFVESVQPTRIISPSHVNYIFYQYSKEYKHNITRPLNSDLFIESKKDFKEKFDRFISFLELVKRYNGKVSNRKSVKQYIKLKEIIKLFILYNNLLEVLGIHLKIQTNLENV